MPPRSIESAFPLTPLQEGMLYHTFMKYGVYYAAAMKAFFESTLY
jgi:hypothetical protein